MPSRRRTHPSTAARLATNRLPLGTPKLDTETASRPNSSASNTSGVAEQASLGSTSVRASQPQQKSPQASLVPNKDMSAKKQPAISLAEAKLRRQNQRIELAEAALTVPVSVRDASHGQSRGRGRVWKPFNSNTDSPREQQRRQDSDDGVPIAGASHLRSAGTSLSRSMSSVSNRAGTLDSDGAGSKALDNTGFQVYTGRRSKGSGMYGSQTAEEKQVTVEASFDKREMYEIFGNALPGPEFIETTTGAKDGQVQFIQHPNGDVSAHQWSLSRYVWENIGQFSNIRKKIEGQLATERLKGETAFQTLQQHSLMYFRAIAKQREAITTGMPFGQKEIQSLLPDRRQPQQEPLAAKKHDENSTPTKIDKASSDLNASSASSLPDSNPNPQRSSGSAGQQSNLRSILSWTDQSPLMGRDASVHVRVPYTSQTAHVPSTFPRFPYYEYLQNTSITAPHTGAYSEQHQDSNRIWPQSIAYTSYGTVAGHLPQLTEAPRPNISYNFVGPSSSMPNMPLISWPGQIQPQRPAVMNQIAGLSGTIPTGTSARSTAIATRPARTNTPSLSTSSKIATPSREAMRDQLLRLGATAKQRNVGQTNVGRTVLYDPFQSQADEKGQTPQSQEMRITNALAQAPAVPFDVPKAKDPAKLGIVFGQTSFPASSLRNDSFTPLPLREDILRDSVPDVPLDNPRRYTVGASQGSASRSSHAPIPALSDSITKKKRNPDEELNDWFTGGNKFTRQEDFYQRLKAASRTTTSNVSSPLSNPAAHPSQSSHPRPIGSAPINQTPEWNESTTRVLIPVYENLAAYVQGPLEKRRDYWCQWTQPPEWCIDRSPSGNDSFFESGWGQPPPRVGRDPRYRPLPGELRFGGFPSPIGGGLSGRRVQYGLRD